MNIITKEDLFAGRFGNGVVIANKRVIEDGDYKNIAHIADKTIAPDRLMPGADIHGIKFILNKSFNALIAAS